jgi:hypothetical protein
VTKYNNRRINTPDGWFDSKRELARWQELKLMQRAGQITNLQRQVKFELIPKISGFRAITYMADFVYEQDGKRVVEDAKGYRNRVYQLKARLMLWRHSIAIVES